MDLFSKYKDNIGRTHVIIQRWAKVTDGSDGSTAGQLLKPNTVVLLDVDNEEPHEVSYQLVEKWIEEKRLIRVEKK